MSVRNKFGIVALLFAFASLLIIYVTGTMSHFWLLIPGVVGVAIFGPWSYYLYAKVKGRRQLSDQEVLTQAKSEFEIKDRK